MQTSEFGKSKGLWKTLTEGKWSDAFDGLGISLLLTANPSIQVSNNISWSCAFHVLDVYFITHIFRWTTDVTDLFCVASTPFLISSKTGS